MANIGTSSRVDFLDGLRAVAILSVIMFHYFSRWTPPLNSTNLYPFGGSIADFPIFKFGWCGVQLFFMISGFVIAMTLERCKSFWEFVIRRYSRLGPAMIFFAAITFLVIASVPDSPFDTKWIDFLPSILFIEPSWLARLPGVSSVSTIDGAYWSLFVEVKFYCVAGTLYFLFQRNMVMLLAILSAMLTALTLLDFGLFTQIAKTLAMATYLPWFLIGIACYNWQTKQAFTQLLLIALLCLVELSLFAVADRKPTDIVIGVVLPIVFICIFILPFLQRILANKYLVSIGASSYGLYLVHQNVGVTLIHSLPELFSRVPMLGVVAAICIAGMLMLLAHFSFERVEKPITRFLLKKML